MAMTWNEKILKKKALYSGNEKIKMKKKILAFTQINHFILGVIQAKVFSQGKCKQAHFN